MSGDSFLLDTNTILYLLDGDKTLSEFLFNKNLYISFITEIELLGYSKISSKEKQIVKSFIEDCIIINVNSEIKRYAISIRSKYNVKLGDCLIAATATFTGFPFITSDKGFEKIKEIDLVLYQK